MSDLVFHVRRIDPRSRLSVGWGCGCREVQVSDEGTVHVANCWSSDCARVRDPQQGERG